MRLAPLLLTSIAITGCSGFVQMMPRDSGKVYQGSVQGSMGGAGKMAIVIDGEHYEGPVVRTGSNGSFGFVQTYGQRSGVTTGLGLGIGSEARVKAILSTSTGKGLRCEFTSDGNGGGGVCVDDSGRVLDAVVSR